MTVVFDFDKTLTLHDTVFGFYKYCNKHKFIAHKIVLFYIFSIIYKLRLISNTRLKKLGVVFFLKGYSRQYLLEKGQQYAKEIKLLTTFETEFKQKFPDAIIASASFLEYLKPIFPNNLLICSSLIYKNEIAVGLEKNIFGNDKKEALIELGFNNIDIFYTDSKTDLPTASLAKKTIWVIKGKLITE